MADLTNRGVIRELMQRHGFTFSKALGQNFIVNGGICPKMAQLCSDDPQVGVLEIGPGIGVLTKELAQRFAKVVSIEIDSRLIPVLHETLADLDNVTVVEGDVLQLDLHQLLEQHFAGMQVVVCANLPYYITSPILMALLEARLPLQSITVMVQKEAAVRLCAPIPSRMSGSITVAAAYYAKAQQLFTVSPGSFFPAPEVDSAVMQLTLHPQPPVEVNTPQLFFKVVRGAFSQRRKTLLNCLSSAFGMDKQQMAEYLAQAGVAPGLRAEQLSLEQFAAIANVMDNSPQQA